MKDNTSTLQKFDAWFDDSGPAALVLREHLMSVEGHDGVLFPATFAASEDRTFRGGYNIDRFPDGTNVCLVDSVGSQANRIEPLFMKDDYRKLVPQVVVKAGKKNINLLEAGHRAGDAIVRCSALQKELHDAFIAALDGNALRLAKIAPTSLVFGVWDSRDTQAKLPRLVDAKIRAFNVRELTRSSNFLVQQRVDYVEEGLLPEAKNDKEKKDYSKRGYLNALASSTHGGVIATGGVRRDATLQLAALQLLTIAGDKQQNLPMLRYILGLSLTAITFRPLSYLRQGCNLVPDAEKSRELKLVYNDGRREDFAIKHEDALEYASAAAEVFGVESDRTVDFDPALAKKDVSDMKKKK